MEREELSQVQGLLFNISFVMWQREQLGAGSLLFVNGKVKGGQKDPSPGSCPVITKASGKGWLGFYLWPDPFPPKKPHKSSLTTAKHYLAAARPQQNPDPFFSRFAFSADKHKVGGAGFKSKEITSSPSKVFKARYRHDTFTSISDQTLINTQNRTEQFSAQNGSKPIIEQKFGAHKLV